MPTNSVRNERKKKKKKSHGSQAHQRDHFPDKRELELHVLKASHREGLGRTVSSEHFGIPKFRLESSNRNAEAEVWDIQATALCLLFRSTELSMEAL